MKASNLHVFTNTSHITVAYNTANVWWR